MLSSLEALEKADAGTSGTRSTVFQPKVKPRARKSGGSDAVSVVKHGANIVVGAKDKTVCTDDFQNASDHEAQSNKNASISKNSITPSDQNAVAAKDVAASLACHSYERDTKQSEALQVLAKDADPSNRGSLPFASRSAIQLPVVESTVGVQGIESIATIPQSLPDSLVQAGQTNLQDQQTAGKLTAEKAHKEKGGLLTEAMATGVEEQSSEPINIYEQTSLQNKQTTDKHQAEKGHKKKGGFFSKPIATGVEEQSSGPVNICGEQTDLQDEQTTGKLKAEKARKKKGVLLTEAIAMGVEEHSNGPTDIRGDENKHTDIENEKRKVGKRKLPHRSAEHKRRVEKTVDITASDPTHLTMKQIIWWAESKERKKLKENASQSKEHVIPASTSQQKVDHPGRADKKAEMAPQVQIIDGQIVINEQSLTISANAANKDDLETYRRVDENSSKLNYHSYMNKTPTERWSSEATELFYKAVRQFGTDFALIQNLFPGRTRRQIKAKFKKEDRLNPFRINSTLEHRSKGYLHYEEVIDILKASSQATDEVDLYDYQLDAYIADPSSRQNGSKMTEEAVSLHPESCDVGSLRGSEENVDSAKPHDQSKIVHTAGQSKRNEGPSTIKGRSKQDSPHLTNDSALNTDLIQESPISNPLSSYQDTESNNPLSSYH